MKKIVVNLIFLVVFAFSLFAGGNRESDNQLWFRAVRDGEEAAFQNFTAQIDYELGKTTITLTWQEGAPAYAVLKDGDRHYNPSLEERNPYDDQLSIIENAAVPAEIIPLEFEQTSQLVETEYAAGILANGLTEAEVAFFTIPEDGTVSFYFWEYWGDKEYTLLLINADNSYQKISFTIAPEFFTGERELFTSNGGADRSYQKKALAFLNTFFPAGDNSFKTFVNDTLEAGMEGADWLIFQNLDEEALINFNNRKESFKRAFIRHFKYDIEEIDYNNQTLNFPYIDFKQRSFDSFYGNYRNIYHSSYLGYIFSQNKPPLSFLLGRELGRYNQIVETPINYNWSQYESISLDESREIAERALWYLTWGVEYTPFNNGNSLSYENSNREIYGKKVNGIFGEDYLFKNFINDWVEGGTSWRDKSDNYLPPLAGISSIRIDDSENEVISKVHNLTGSWPGDKLTFFVPAEAEASFPISRVDLFAAKNIAWDTTRIKEAVCNTGSNISALNDRKIYLNNEDNNFHASRPDIEKTDRFIEVGYEFNRPETIGGIVLVIGKGSPGERIARSEFSEFKLWNIKRKNSDGTWTKVFNNDSSNYREYVFDYHEDLLFYERSHCPGRSLGWKDADGTDLFTDKATKVSYVYINFPEGITDCYGIRIFDNIVTNEFLNIAEMMIFESDPVPWLTGNCATEGTITLDNLFSSVNASGVWSESGLADSGLLLLNNADFDTTFAIENSSPLEIDLGANYEIKNIVLWEGNHTEGNSALSREVTVFSGNSELMNSEYFSYGSAEYIGGLRNMIQRYMKSPYLLRTHSIAFAGNPIPYAPSGIDSPRTFNYKMVQQAKAREWIKSSVLNDEDEENNYLIDNFPSGWTTFAEDSVGERLYNEGYVTEIDTWYQSEQNLLALDSSFLYTNENAEVVRDGNQAVIKPFLPGWNANTEAGYIETGNSPYSVNKVAGVDAMGMFMGTVAMTGQLSNVLNVFNQDIPAELDKYYAMENVADGVNPPAGLGEDGKPLFHLSGEAQSFLNGNYRFNRADFEKNSLLIPDVSFVRQGDFLIKYESDGQPHIGVVAAILNENERPAFGEDPTDFMDNIIVVSVRKGFQMAALGSWGNPEGLFGGFTIDPKAYQIRRLLKLKGDGDLNTRYREDAWELVKEIPIKTWEGYPGEIHIPRAWIGAPRYNSVNGRTIAVDEVNYTINNIDDYVSYQKAWMVSNGYTHLKKYPPTSYPFIKAQAPTYITNNVPLKGFLRVTCFPGWRSLLLTSPTWNNRFNTHRGIDLIGTGNRANIFEAPESGRFWIDHWDDRRPRDGDYIELPNNGGRIDGGSGFNGALGNIGVLVSNHNNPKLGRVYLFCHMDDRPAGAITLYNNLTGGNTYPDSVANGIDVQRGVQIVNDIEYGIGYIGTTFYEWKNAQWINTGIGRHIHLEIYEYFEDVQGIDADDTTEHWLRVDPLSCFYTEEELEEVQGIKLWGSYQFDDMDLLYNKNYGIRQDTIAISYPGANQSDEYLNLFTDEEIQNHFREWYK